MNSLGEAEKHQLDREPHHSVRLDPVDEGWHGDDTLALKAAHELRNVSLLGNDVLAVEQHRHGGRARPVPERPVLPVPRQVMCWRGKVAVIVRMQAPCTSQQSLLYHFVSNTRHG